MRSTQPQLSRNHLYASTSHVTRIGAGSAGDIREEIEMGAMRRRDETVILNKYR